MHSVCLCRTDSDIYLPYTQTQFLTEGALAESNAKTFDETLSKKNKLAVWVAGNCVYTRGGYNVLEKASLRRWTSEGFFPRQDNSKFF